MNKAKGKRQKVKVKTRNRRVMGQAITTTLMVCAFDFLLLPFDLARACPLCKEALFDPGQLHQKLALARGYALSIGLMLAMPLALVAGLTLMIVRAQRRKHRG